MKQMKTLGELLACRNEVVGTQYLDAKSFISNSIRNIRRMTVLEDADDFLFVMHPVAGFVFDQNDIRDPELSGDLVPVMRITLRDSEVSDCKQASRICVRQGYDGAEIATKWLLSYIDQAGSICIGMSSLTGDFDLLKILIKAVMENPDEYRLKLYNGRSELVVDGGSLCVLGCEHSDLPQKDLMLVRSKKEA